MMGDQLVMWPPLTGFLPYLAEGWRLSGLVQNSHRNRWAVLLYREVADA